MMTHIQRPLYRQALMIANSSYGRLRTDREGELVEHAKQVVYLQAMGFIPETRLSHGDRTHTGFVIWWCALHSPDYTLDMGFGPYGLTS